ncbi:MAG: DMT family transporter [Firmicutes bacterium]|nr:DMT family transporter [Bacillota bacterium]NLH87163.1 DMT family transporter [Bacillota bacterium]
MKSWRLRPYRSVLADLSLVGICVIWGTSFAIVKSVVGETNPATFIAARFTLAAILLGLIASRRLHKLDRELWKAGFVLAVPLMLGFLAQTYGLQGTTASKAGFITGMHVVFTPFLEQKFLRNRIMPYQMAGVGVAVAGLGLLTLDRLSPPTYGDLLVLACAFCFAVHLVLLGHYSPAMDGLLLSVTQMVWAAVFSILVAGSDMVQVVQFDKDLILSVAYLGVMGTALAYLVQTTAQKYTPPTRAALILQTEPVFSSFFARLWLDERFNIQQSVGAILILAGILLCQVGDVRRSREV